MSGSGSSVGIATRYGLDGPGIESPWEARFSAPVQTGPGAQTASCTMSTGSFPGVKSGRVVTLSAHPLLVPWSRKGRVIPLLPLWAVRSVQSLSVCTRVHFTLRIMNSTLNNISLTLFSVGTSHMSIKYVLYFRMTNQGSHQHKPQANCWKRCYISM